MLSPILLAACATGTSVVFVASGDFVILAADGIVKHTSRLGTGTTGFGQDCKILKQGNIFYAASGEYSIPDLQFDLKSIARSAILKAGTVRNIYTPIEMPILARLDAIARYSKTASPTEYAKWIKGVPVISIGFASFEDNAPTVAVVEFLVDAQGTSAPSRKNTFRGVPGRIQLAALGWNAEIMAASDPPAWDQRFLANPISTVQSLIQREIEASKREKRYDVGLPISIARISRNFSGWVPGYEGACRAGR